MRSPIRLGAAILATLSPPLVAAPAYVASVIEAPGEIGDHYHADLDGDDRHDLLLAVWSESRGRELLLYAQGENGLFPAEPSRRIELKKDIVAWAIADLRPEAGQELAFFTRSAAYSYSPREDGYAGNLQKLFDWDFLISVPGQKSAAFLGHLQDYDGDGRSDILLPGRHGYGLSLAAADGSYPPPRALPRPYDNPQLQERNDISVDVSFEEGLSLQVQRANPLSELVPPDDAGQPRNWNRFGEGESILDAAQWIAVLQATPLDSQPGLDFAWVDDPEVEENSGERRFNILYGAGEGIARGEVDWQASVGKASWLQFHDVDGDGRSDVLAMSGRGQDQGTLAFYRNHDGRFDFRKPDQVMRFSGYEVEVQLQDLDGDERPELIVSYYSIAPVDALRKGSMLRSTLIYPPSPTGEQAPFVARPAARIDDRFSADNVKALGARLDFSADIDGDGRPDMVGLDAAGALVGRSLDGKLQPAAEAVWRYVPQQLIQWLDAADLNDDGRGDFILRHQNAVSVLVSRP